MIDYEKAYKEALVRAHVAPSDTYLVRGGSTTREEAEAWLEKQKEQKPAEWSNKDEEMMTEIIEFLEYAYPYDNEFRIAWLKSLRGRPKSSDNWKPSEEQMNRLFSIVAALREDYCDDMADFLANLYTDLKNLGVKEEPEYYQHFDPDC